MPIPDRFLPPPISDAEMHNFSEMCDAIGDGEPNAPEIEAMLKKWNERAGRVYERVEFRTYYGAIDKEDFVRGALFGVPTFCEDLRYSELKDILEAVYSAELSEAENGYYLEWLEINLPESNISDLIYWPNEWFQNQDLLHLELTSDQMLRYATIVSGRILPGAPGNVELPHPVPDHLS